MRRKDFLRLGGLLAGASAQAAVFAGTTGGKAAPRISSTVDFTHDGLALTPKEYSELLMRLADEGKIKPDYYSNGGVVEEMENKFAALTGKESAVFLPTGTLANHIAVRKLSGSNSRVIVQEQSHLYNDSGDCSQTLSGLNLIPLGTNEVEFSLEEVERQFKKAKTDRVETRLACISLETPVRRKMDRMFDFNNIKQISAYAKNNSIKMHLDGARLFVQSVHTNKSPAEYGEQFDTVYTSLWKCFNAASGAVLAGPKSFTTNLFHERRMFGGSLPAAWAFAAVALYYADGFINEYKAAWQKAEIFLSALQKESRFEVIRFPAGSHIVRINPKNVDLLKFKESLSKKNIELMDPFQTGFLLKINPSINKGNPENLARLFIDSLNS